MTEEAHNTGEEVEVLPALPRSLLSTPDAQVYDTRGRPERTVAPEPVSTATRPFGSLFSAALFMLGAAVILWAAGFEPIAWLQGAGAVGIVACVVVVALVTPMFVPSGLMAVLPGWLWGPVTGTATILAGAAIGGLLNMWLARRFFGHRVSGWVNSNPALAGLQGAIQQRGFRIALALRLSPVTPYSMLAYLAGIAGLNYAKFAAASVLGGIPWTFVYATAGAMFATAGTERSIFDVSVQGPVWLRWLGFGLTIFVAVWIGRLARRELMRVRGA